MSAFTRIGLLATSPILPPIESVYFLAASLPALVIAETQSSWSGHLLLKTLSSAAFCYGPVKLLLDGASSTYLKLIAAGLLASLIGDICLVPPKATYHEAPIAGRKREPSTEFKLGIVAFAVAHGAYIAAFLNNTISIDLPVVSSVFVGTMALAKALGVIYPPAPGYRGINLFDLHIEGEMRPLVTGYAAIISTMLAAAAATSGPAAAGAGGWEWQRLLGAVMFVISDLFVAKDAFGQVAERPHAWWKLASGWGLYFWGQMILAGSAY